MGRRGSLRSTSVRTRPLPSPTSAASAVENSLPSLWSKTELKVEHSLFGPSPVPPPL
jgi:hypothetical protein